MVTFKHVPVSGDPSDRVQHFVSINPGIICCRYWWLEKWTSHEMSFPYWRLYWNKNEGAYVKTHEKVYLSPDKIVLIPPNTSFSTGIDYQDVIPDNPNDLVGSRVTDQEDENRRLKEGKILHLFIHFNLGLHLDKINKEIYVFTVQQEEQNLIDSIIDKLLTDNQDFDTLTTLKIHKLILSAIAQIPAEHLHIPKTDPRINRVLDFIDYNLNSRLTNDQLAKQIFMSKNAFTRFFREQTQCSPQEYIRKIRIDTACNLLDRGDLTIDEIAERCGFTDRFHLSKVFKKAKGLPPAEYRKRFVLGFNHVKQ